RLRAPRRVPSSRRARGHGEHRPDRQRAAGHDPHRPRHRGARAHPDVPRLRHEHRPPRRRRPRGAPARRRDSRRRRDRAAAGLGVRVGQGRHRPGLAVQPRRRDGPHPRPGPARPRRRRAHRAGTDRQSARRAQHPRAARRRRPHRPCRRGPPPARAPGRPARPLLRHRGARAALMDRPNLNIGDGGAGADFTNPVIFADVPDPDVVFDGRYYYMVSTTMYFAPSVPIMRSSDLVHWSIAGYTAAILDDADALALRNGQDAYGQGSWAASIRFHDGTYYVSVGSLTTQQTYVYSTPDIERGPWSRSVLDGYAHDQSLLVDGGGSIDLRRLRRHDDGTLAWDGSATRLVEDANVDQTSGLNAEGAHAYKIGDYYYVFMIEWPSGGIRQEVLWRSTSLTPQSAGGVWEGRVVLSQAVTVGGRPGT